MKTCSIEKSTDSLIVVPLQVNSLFYLAAFKILSLHFIFESLIIMFYHEVHFCLKLFGDFRILYTCMTKYLLKFGEFSAIYLNRLYAHSSLLLFLFPQCIYSFVCWCPTVLMNYFTFILFSP